MREGALFLFFIFIAFMLGDSPLVFHFAWMKLDVMVLVLCYGALIKPSFALLITFVVGLMLDVAHGAFLGLHAFALLLPVYLSLCYRSKLIESTLTTHFLWMGAQVILYQIILFCLYGFKGQLPVGADYYLAPLIVLCIVPAAYMMLKSRFFRVKGV